MDNARVRVWFKGTDRYVGFFPRHLQLILLAADGSADKIRSKENVFESGEINTGIFVMLDDKSAFLELWECGFGIRSCSCLETRPGGPCTCPSASHQSWEAASLKLCIAHLSKIRNIV